MYPENHRKGWSSKDLNTMFKMKINRSANKTIAKKLKRTSGAIIMQLKLVDYVVDYKSTHGFKDIARLLTVAMDSGYAKTTNNKGK